ncbi:DUF1579 family protein [Falsiroseomonas oryzae]|uniref:DUF1579 family protein n=1 Tax=Falsiroseomonas oryzae TaxID=2766473 RepID=UPI0022EB9B5D|nr:DUF1579 family protein [Roseomonas sp. MO-31]
MDMQPAATDRDLTMTRRIPAPPGTVFSAWTEPDRVRQWFGPRNMTTPVCEIDLRPGGRHHTVMRDAEGKDYPNPMVIEAVEAPRLLVLRVPEGSSCPLPGSVGTLLFLPDGEGTRLEVTWRHPTPEMRARHAEMGFDQGWGETLDKLVAHVVTPPVGCPVATPAAVEHGWLHRMVGDWAYESECSMGPGQPPASASGVERVRALGGYWVVGESEGEMPGGGPARWTISLGFDPCAQRFRGTFIGSMMPHMFVYDGWLEPDGRTLVLESEGPAMDGQGTARYRDVVRLESDDARVVTSEVQGPEGWTAFMTARFRRTA